MGKTKSSEKLPTKSAGLSSSLKREKYRQIPVRRSGRIQNAVLPQPQSNHDNEPTVEEITVGESEQEDEQSAPHKENLHELVHESILIEKIDYIVQLLETQEKAIRALKLKDNENPSLSNGFSPMDVRYKSLYIESQKKIEALKEENCQLVQKVEIALGKVEAYETANQYFSEVMEKLKDVVLVSNQAVRDAMTADTVRVTKSSATAKRKKVA